MRKTDNLNLNSKALRTFLAILEEESISKAAQRLGVTQSAVSHSLEKLRITLDDPLFVRQGRGIVATAKAKSLAEPIESILAGFTALQSDREFDPKADFPEITIATNDFPLLLIFPTLLRSIYTEGIDPMLRFIPSGVPMANLKRASRCQLLITPAPPKGKNIIKEELLKSPMACFYDASIRKPPGTLQEFAASRYVEVRFSGTESSMMVFPEIDPTKLKEPTITVPNFADLEAFIKGTDLITTQLEVMQRGVLKDLDCAPLPMDARPLTLYLVWHQRDADDPAHKWLRLKILDTVKTIFAE